MSLDQKGVFRINCLDCLDRTNIFQTALALLVCQEIFESSPVAGELSVEQLLDDSINPQPQLFVKNFKQLWFQNNESLTNCYCSCWSPSHLLKSHFESQAYFKKMDEEQIDFQLLIEKILGYPSPLPISPVELIHEKLKERQGDFHKRKDFTLYCVTWNVNAHSPKEAQEYIPLFDFNGNPPSDLVVISLQEVVTLNAVNVIISSNDNEVSAWRDTLIQAARLAAPDVYTPIAWENMVGCLLIVLCRKSLINNVYCNNSSAIKQGFGSSFGNKGAVIINLNIFGSLCCIVGVHLPAGSGRKSQETRIQAFEDIQSKVLQPDVGWVLLAGDTNFRVNVDFAQAIEFMQKYKEAESKKLFDASRFILRQLLDNEQLILLEKYKNTKNLLLKQFQEGDIDFAPTYKFDIGTDNYDTSKKQRVPSWTDRILFASPYYNHAFSTKFYESIKGDFTRQSDHRPVNAYIKTTVDAPHDPNKQRVLIELLQTAIKAESFIKLGKQHSDNYFFLNNNELKQKYLVSEKLLGTQNLSENNIEEMKYSQ